jgi:hypothetical protein
LAGADGAAKLTDSQQCELRVARDRVQKKLDTATSENARLSRAAAEKDRVLADARTRVEYLEAALAAAEAECGRLTADAAKACDKHQAETSRAITTEKLWPRRGNVCWPASSRSTPCGNVLRRQTPSPTRPTTGSASSKMKKIKALVERNAWLEAARDRAGSPNQRGRETPQSSLEDAADAALSDWAGLARLLGDFVERKTATTPATRRARSAA